MAEETREIHFLRAAREAMSSGEIKDAISMYEIAFYENSENPEAKYFYHFNKFANSFIKGEELEYPFLYLINSLEFAVKYVADFDCSDHEKSIVITNMTATYSIIFDYIVEAYETLGIDLIDDYIMGLYWLGSYIKNDFKEKPNFIDFAIEPWEKAIELHQKYGCKHENYKVENYAEELKKINPDYIIPDKPIENAREKWNRENAELVAQRAKDKAQQKIALEQEEAKKAEAKAKREAEERAKKEKEKIQLIIIAAIIAVIVILGGILPYFF